MLISLAAAQRSSGCAYSLPNIISPFLLPSQPSSSVSTVSTGSRNQDKGNDSEASLPCPSQSVLNKRLTVYSRLTPLGRHKNAPPKHNALSMKLPFQYGGSKKNNQGPLLGGSVFLHSSIWHQKHVAVRVSLPSKLAKKCFLSTLSSFSF